MSCERVIWDTCPCCGRCAAVGWLDGVAVRFDCPGDCRPTAREVARLGHGSSGPAWVARWAAVAAASPW